MITSRMRGSKKYISSSYFDDIRLLRKSKYDTDYLDLKRNTEFDVLELKRAYIIQEIILWRRGCIELSDFAGKIPNNQLAGISTVYMGEDWEEYTDPISLEDEEKVIADPDN